MTEDTKSEWQFAGEGIRRKILAHNPEAMTVQVEFIEGAYAELHNHPHVQTVYVRDGSFEFTIAGESFPVKAGDSLAIPSMAMHDCKCIEAGTLIDSFAPRRDDFL